MAQKRMIDKKISVSEQVASLPIEAQLIFTWSIPHSDDVGLLPYSPRTLKAMIVPMLEMPPATFEKHMAAIVEQGLWRVFEHEGEKYYRLISFTSHQTLKKDRQPQTLLKIKVFKDQKRTWQSLEDIGFQLEDNGIQMESEGKRREGNRSEVKGSMGPKARIEYLANIPAEDIKEFTARFMATEKQIKSKAEDLRLYCERKGRKYQNYRSFLLNALKRDFKEREEAAGGKYKNL